MAEVIPHENHFNHIRTSELDEIYLFVMLQLEDSVPSKKKVITQADITQREERMDHGKDVEWTEKQKEQEKAGYRDLLIASC